MRASSSTSGSASFFEGACSSATLLRRSDDARTGIISNPRFLRKVLNVMSVLCSYWWMIVFKASLNRSASSPRPFSQYSRT